MNNGWIGAAWIALITLHLASAAFLLVMGFRYNWSRPAADAVHAPVPMDLKQETTPAQETPPLKEAPRPANSPQDVAPPPVPSLPEPTPAAPDSDRDGAGFSFNLPKIPGEGEDADPVFSRLPDGRWLLGVFDGMGGRGSRQYRRHSTGQSHSGGWLASRVVREFVADRAGHFMQHPVPELAKTWPAELQTALHTFLKQELTAPESRVKGSLVSELPTTMVCLLVDAQPDGLGLEWLNAGDSRAYVLDPAEGLRSLTRDDVKSPCDELESLVSDPPLALFVSASQTFTIQTGKARVARHAVVFTATDGCFGYLDSPMHFEHLMLRTLLAAASCGDWSRRISAELSAVAADDCSMALLAPSGIPLPGLQSLFAPRLAWLEENFIHPLNELRARQQDAGEFLSSAQAAASDASRIYSGTRERLWRSYQLSRRPA